MAAEPEKHNDLEILDENEYERALETLNASKSSRIKKIKDKKKESSAKEKKDKTSGFDPVIPICLILAVLVTISALIYFILPIAVNPAMPFNYEEFSVRFKAADMYQRLFSEFDMDIDDVEYIHNSGDSDKSQIFDVTKNGFYLDSFEKLVNPHFGAAIQGQSRKFDGKLTLLRAIVEYDDRVSNYSFMSFYFAGFLDAVYSDLSSEDCYNMATTALSKFDGTGNYTVYGDYAYRIVYGADEASKVAYFAMEIVPAKSV
ncbi:MAG: hypothetical protein IKE53_07430 [Clostridiales bacterium]|nr:hypothetical protein [Clostridiales bacterium]